MTEKIKEPARIYIIDENIFIYYGLRSIFSKEEDLTICGRALDMITAIKEINQLRPDLIIVEPYPLHSEKMELIKNLKLLFPEIPLLALSYCDSEDYSEKTIRDGAYGYIVKSESIFNIIKAIREIIFGINYSNLEGKKYLHK